MDICNDGHSEIVYDQRHCPLCEVLKELKDTENQIEKLEKDSDHYQDEIYSLEKKVKDLLFFRGLSE